MIDRIVIKDRLHDGGHDVWIVGRDYPGARRSVWNGTEWVDIAENVSIDAPAPVVLPEGVLDALCKEHLGAEANVPATAQHRDDAVYVRDRLLDIVERCAMPPRLIDLEHKP